jgi:ribonuclease BN (tRNA processing enzyme)
VAVTHLHGDHFGGLPFLILYGQFSRRSAPVQVAGPPGVRTRLAEAMEALFPGSSQAQRRFPVEVTGLGTDGKAAGLGAGRKPGPHSHRQPERSVWNDREAFRVLDYGGRH